MTPRERLIVALDVPTAEEARRARRRAWPAPSACSRSAASSSPPPAPTSCASWWRAASSVFLDLKFHDIPNTVAGAVASAGQLGRLAASTCTASGGRGDDRGGRPARCPRSARASWPSPSSRATTTEPGRGRRARSVGRHRCERLARLAQDAGVDGVVASPHEVALVREACGPDFLIVTPGIRPAGAARGRPGAPATPAAALARRRRLPRGRPPDHAIRRPPGGGGCDRRRDRRHNPIRALPYQADRARFGLVHYPRALH